MNCGIDAINKEVLQNSKDKYNYYVKLRFFSLMSYWRIDINITVWVILPIYQSLILDMEERKSYIINKDIILEDSMFMWNKV